MRHQDLLALMSANWVAKSHPEQSPYFQLPFRHSHGGATGAETQYRHLLTTTKSVHAEETLDTSALSPNLASVADAAALGMHEGYVREFRCLACPIDAALATGLGVELVLSDRAGHGSPSVVARTHGPTGTKPGDDGCVPSVRAKSTATARNSGLTPRICSLKLTAPCPGSLSLPSSEEKILISRMSRRANHK